MHTKGDLGPATRQLAAFGVECLLGIRVEHTWGSADLGPTPSAHQLPRDLTQHSLPGLPLSIWEAGLTPLFLGSVGVGIPR